MKQLTSLKATLAGLEPAKLAGLAVAALAVLALVICLWAFRRQPRKPLSLPTEWALTARPVFSTDERRVYRLLREALPHHIVLSKLPLVRFCQPTDPAEVRYWFDLLGTSNVTYGSYPYSHSSSLFDVTSGSNGNCGGSYLCTGVNGYDGPSGLGTPNGTGGF